MASSSDILSQPMSSEVDEDFDKDKAILVYTDPTIGEENGALGLRRPSHTPPVITINDISEIQDNQKQSECISSPVPQSSDVVDHAGSHTVVSSKNPFESSPEDPKLEDIQSTNPFHSFSPKSTEDMPKAVSSTNPFEEELVTPITNDTNAHLVRAKTEVKENKKRNSFASSGHRLSLSLSRHSISSNTTTNTMNEDPKTPIKKHRFNPFKRILSRNSTTTEDEEEDRLGSFDMKNNTQNDNSSRRNALHGPF